LLELVCSLLIQISERIGIIEEGRDMNFTMAGIILFTQKYEECVVFYGQTLELEILHRIDRVGEQLTTFMLGDTYLMIETGGVAHEGKKTVANSPIKFRFNVPDVKANCGQRLIPFVPADLHVEATELMIGA
jgi:lactoylglutathione lyase